MEPTIREIAALLRATEPMAAQFAQRVQDRVGQPVSHAEILAVMRKIPARSLSLEKVVTKVQEGYKREQRRGQRTGRRGSAAATRPPAHPAKAPQTVLEQLQDLLQENWNRAEAEGLRPNRMSTAAFVNAVYHHTDRREATPRRMLQAARQLDEADVLLTPALVADAIHELFQAA